MPYSVLFTRINFIYKYVERKRTKGRGRERERSVHARTNITSEIQWKLFSSDCRRYVLHSNRFTPVLIQWRKQQQQQQKLTFSLLLLMFLASLTLRVCVCVVLLPKYYQFGFVLFHCNGWRDEWSIKCAPMSDVTGIDFYNFSLFLSLCIYSSILIHIASIQTHTHTYILNISGTDSIPNSFLWCCSMEKLKENVKIQEQHIQCLRWWWRRRWIEWMAPLIREDWPKKKKTTNLQTQLRWEMFHIHTTKEEEEEKTTSNRSIWVKYEHSI